MRWSARVTRHARGLGKRRKNRFFSPTRKKTASTDRVRRSALPSWGGTRDLARCPCERSVPRKRKIRERVRVRRPREGRWTRGHRAARPGPGMGLARASRGRAGGRTHLSCAGRAARDGPARGGAASAQRRGRRADHVLRVRRSHHLVRPGEVAASRRPGAFEDRGLARGRFGDCRSEDASRWFVSRRLGCVEE